MRHWATPFVLAMLLLRALVPAGFMLAPVDGGLAVVLCDADGAASLYRHAGHAMSAGAVAGQSGAAMSAGAVAGQSGAAMSARAVADPSGDAMSAGAAMPGQSGHAMPPADMGSMSAADMSGHDMSTTDMAGHAMPGHPGGHTHPDPTCPYAQSSGATPIPFLAAVTPAIESAPSVLPDPAAQTHAHFGPTREQSPRGPPHLA